MSPFIKDSNATKDLRIEPDGTDVIGTGAAGKYFEADDEGDLMWLQDVASGIWAVINSMGSWAEES